MNYSNKSSITHFTFLILFILGLSGCGGGSSGDEPDPDSSEDDNSQPVTQTAPEPGELSFIDNLFTKLNDGDWTREEGLVASLKLMTAESNATEVLRESPTINKEGTGIVAMAREYVAGGTNAQAKAEISRLLNLIVFSDEQLQAMSGINTASSQAGINGRDTTTNPVTDCVNFFLGYEINPGEVGKCLEYKRSQKLHDQFGKDFVIYHPAPGLPSGGWTQKNYDNAFEAMEKTVPIFDDYFKKLGKKPPALSIYFSPANSAVAAASAAPDVTRPCGIALYTNMRSDPDNNFKQIVAHEIGHCFQEEMFLQNKVAYEHRMWREEGYAEYLSNVVYPDNNLEWSDWLVPLQHTELSKPLMDRDYMNFIFFQYLQNRLGDDGLIDLILTLPTDGDKKKQEDTLANFTDMEAIFHDFAEAMTDGSVIDSSKVKIPYSLVESNRPTVKLKNLDIIDEDFPRPFSISRYRLILDEDERADLNFSNEGTIQKSARPVDDKVWVDVPEELPNDNCKPEIIMVVTTLEAKSSFELEIPKVDEESKSCDIIGEWSVDNDSLWFEPSAHDLDSIFGEIRITFYDDGRVEIVYSNHGYKVSATRQLSVGGVEIERFEEFTHTTNAQGETTYEVDNNRINFDKFFESSFLEGTETIHHIRIFNPPNMIGSNIDETKERDADGWGIFSGSPRFIFHNNNTIHFIEEDGDVYAVLNRTGSVEEN